MNQENDMIIRRAEDRGVAEHGWLHSRHTFSFGGYFDAKHMGFHALRVINDDRVQPGKGFGTHPHKNMEIISYVVSGELEHKDSMGNGSVIRPEDIQRMTAGTGVSHSEFNPHPDRPVHFLQIWIQPEKPGLNPGYEQKTFRRDEKTNTLRLVASPDGSEGSLTIHQDVRMYAALLEPGTTFSAAFDADRHLWVQLIRGQVILNKMSLKTGDAAALEEGTTLTFKALEPSELLVFDLGDY